MQTQQEKPNSDQLLVKEAAVETEVPGLSSVIPPDLFLLEDVQRELAEIREEVDETCAVVDNVRAVPESAYDETLSLLKMMQRDSLCPT